MASPIRVPKTNGPAGEAARMTASEAKNGFGRVLDRVAKDGAVVITKHDRPDAVILSIEAYQRLAQPRARDIDALTAQFDALYERLQQPGTADKIEAVFALSPAELGRIAVARASASAKPKKQAARRARRARG
jgi:prevent-host-death family protein